MCSTMSDTEIRNTKTFRPCIYYRNSSLSIIIIIKHLLLVFVQLMLFFFHYRPIVLRPVGCSPILVKAMIIFNYNSPCVASPTRTPSPSSPDGDCRRFGAARHSTRCTPRPISVSNEDHRNHEIMLFYNSTTPLGRSKWS